MKTKIDNFVRYINSIQANKVYKVPAERTARHALLKHPLPTMFVQYDYGFGGSAVRITYTP